MKTKLLNILTAVILFLMPNVNFGQAPNLGTAANFALFTTVGMCENTGITYNTHITGNVGSNSGAVSGYGNVNGVMTFPSDPLSMQAEADLLVVAGQLDAATPNNFPPGISLGSGPGQILFGGVHSMTNATLTLDQNLILDAQGDPSKVFIFQLHGAFSSNASATVKLINGALACNVFWKVDGMVSLATGTSMKGTIVATAAISLATLDTLEGRALAINGDINVVTGDLIYTPIGCGSPVLVGPQAPELGTAACYSIFSSDGAVSNTGITFVTGDIGTNNGLTTGYDALNVTGTIHTIPDGSTGQCAADLLVAYNYVNTLPYDIELLYPEQFGNNLVLTPHTYLMNAAATFIDTLFLNALGDTNAVFVIQINGALSTSTYSNVHLINGAQAKNVYWKIEGAVSINDYSVFRGTIICNNGAFGALNTGVELDGRALLTVGALTTSATTAVMPFSCDSVVTGIASTNVKKTNVVFSIYPNPFTTSLNFTINDGLQINDYELQIYNVLGAVVMNTTVSKQLTTIGTSNIPAGIYFYKISSNNKTVQTGKLISR